ncbi:MULTISPECIES: hypothetical protein [unclassified Rhizobium]|uniref:hypothetical protein n=1 Tax=unclassified Rhizobium TaxID=2613769 RepID=UPI001B11CED3|nr:MULTISPECIES: hypothetical protein [unclassified Rhizobium]MBO9100863.1 hypothetical protein [Rhizobium sp. L58/93]
MSVILRTFAKVRRQKKAVRTKPLTEAAPIIHNIKRDPIQKRNSHFTAAACAVSNPLGSQVKAVRPVATVFKRQM